jgi:hypothetical protein
MPRLIVADLALEISKTARISFISQSYTWKPKPSSGLARLLP